MDVKSSTIVNRRLSVETLAILMWLILAEAGSAAVSTQSGEDAALSWTQVTLTAPWSARDGHSTLVFQGRLWLLGGNEGPGGYQESNDVWYSSYDGLGWTQATPHAAWTPRQYFGSTVFDDKLWVLGGIGPTTCDVWYSGDGVNWTQATEHAGWSGRAHFGVAVFEGKLWVIGGDYRYNDVWFSADGVSWSVATANAAWPPRYGHTVTVFNGEMWLMGGHSSAGTGRDLNDIWRSSDGVNWTEVSTNPVWPVRFLHTATVFDGSMWVLGGLYGEGYPRARLYWLNDVWRSTNGVSWVQVAEHAPWPPRFGHTSAVLNNRLWVLGGETYSGHDRVLLNDVWCLSSAATEGEGEPPSGPHTADQNGDWQVGLPELLRVIQFYNSGGFHCAENPVDTEDGYAPGPGANQACARHASDYLSGADWAISLTELLRLIQLYNTGGYHLCPGEGTPDGYCPGIA